MLLIIAFNGKQWLAVLDVELRHYHARPKHIAEKRDVVVVGELREDPPVLHLLMQRLMTCPHPGLHRPLLRWIHVIHGAFHLTCYTHGRGGPSSASTRSPSSMRCMRTFLKNLKSVYLPAGYSREPGSTPGSPRGCRRPARSAGRTSLRTCGTQMRFLSL